MAQSWAKLFWMNPEFVRNRRAELRPVRAITVAVVIVVICALIGLACWSNAQSARYATVDPDAGHAAALLYYRWLVILQALAITFWTLFSCAQSISGERDRKTWEFQRTTRLTSAEILIGKLLGEPVLVYFAVLCAAPITVLAGLAAGVPLFKVISVYVLLAVTSLFLGLLGLWLSMLLESRTRGVGLLGALGLYGFVLGAFPLFESGLPGLAAISPVTGLMQLLGDGTEMNGIRPVFFGVELPWLLMTTLLCACFGAWLVLMLVRNLKRDYPEIRPLSRWQAVGCAAFLNFLIYALLSPGVNMGGPRTGWFIDAHNVAIFAVAMNGGFLFLTGLATLTPRERLKVWRRKRTAGQSATFADDGLPWPWLGISAVVAYALLVWGLLSWDHALPLDMGTLQSAAIRLFIVFVFVTRDVLFLQWCMLTRLRQPIVKGVLFLGLYYVAAAVLTLLAAVSSQDAAGTVAALLTPTRVFDAEVRGLAFPAAVYAGLVLQMVTISAVILAIDNRLQRPAQTGAAA